MTHLTYDTPDIADFVCTSSKYGIGTRLLHSSRLKMYVITDFCWLGADDQWGYVHRLTEPGSVLIVRPMSHIEGNKSDGTPRYMEVS